MLIIWGFLQLAFGVIVNYLVQRFAIQDYLIWFGIGNLVVWFFIGRYSVYQLKNKAIDQTMLASLQANLIGILAFIIYYLELFATSIIFSYSQHYFLPMTELIKRIMNQDIISQILYLDKVFLISLLLHMLVFGVGYITGKKQTLLE